MKKTASGVYFRGRLRYDYLTSKNDDNVKETEMNEIIEHDESADGSYGSCDCETCIALDRIIDEEGGGSPCA